LPVLCCLLSVLCCLIQKALARGGVIIQHEQA